MATRDLTSDAASNNITTGERDTLNSNITTGAIIRASHINDLKTRINNVCGHTHGINDATKIGEYGNQKSTSTTDEDTDGAGTDSGLANRTVGSTIYASEHNSLATAVNTVQSHNHGWTDN